MKTRWMIPAAVAMALHALAMFGFREAPCHILPAAKPGKMVPACPPALVEIAERPETDDSSPDAVRGGPDVPRSEDSVVAPRENSDIFTMAPVRPSLGPVSPIWIIPSDPSGPGDGGNTGPGSEVIPVSSLDHLPKTRSQTAPIYPYEAKNHGRAGEVLVEFTVDESGRVLNPHVVRSTDPVFETPTLRAVAKWRFEPGHKNGRAVRFRMALPVQFSLND